MKILAALSPLSLLLVAAFLPGGGDTTPADNATWKVDPVHSSAIFRIHHAGAAFFYGRFNQVEGSVEYDADNPEEAQVSFRIKADSVDTNATRRDRHVKSPDFLDAKQFPWITFEGTEVIETGDDEFTVVGELELAGVSKEVTMVVTYTGEGEFQRATRRGFEAIFTIDRSEFGITYGLDQGILAKDIKLMIGLELIKQ